MIPFRVDIPPHVAVVIRSLHPDLKALIKSTIRAIAADQNKRIIRLMAVGHRRSIHEVLSEQFRRKTGP